MKIRGLMGAAKVLVVKRDGLRAFVEAEPAFAAIRRAHPEATVDLVTSPQMQRLAKCSPYFDRVVAMRENLVGAERKSLADQLKKIGYGIAYDLDGTRESMDLRGLLKGFRSPHWVGPKRPLGQAKRSLSPSPLAGPAVRKLLSDSGLDLEHRLPDLRWIKDPKKASANLDPSWFGISGPFALFIPAGDAVHRWPAEHYGAVAASMGKQGVTPVIVGGADLGPFAYDVMQIAAELSRATGRTAIDLTGKADPAQVSVLAAHAHFFLAGPSEELHLVAAAGTPGVLLLPASEDVSTDALFGREVVKLTANNIARLTPDLALMTLKNMGLLRSAALVGARQIA